EDEAVPQVRPFVRFCARSFDEAVLSTVLLLFWINLFHKVTVLPSLIYGIILVLVWAVIEAVLISTWGTTLGKWLLCVKVRNIDGNKLSFTQSLMRAFLAVTVGKGLNIEFLNLVTTLSSYYYISKNGCTIWDKVGHFTVSHERIGRVRAFIFISLYVLLLTTEIMSTFMLTQGLRF
ncbi:MAG: RDD family protein, partial [Clostridia bacterium]|nr:RDD family protein [Clostridia bacterium]